MKSRVLFFDYSRKGNVLGGLEALFNGLGLAKVARGSVAVKLHMGELGNTAYLRPIFAARIISLVKSAGGWPFATDTTVNYPGGRGTVAGYLATAASNGFVADSIGAPIVIAGDDENSAISLPVPNPIQGCQLREVRLASEIYVADNMLVLSHVKGHALSGFGGALKNLAMGCVTKATKRAQHMVNCPAHDDSRCDLCGDCVKICPTAALTISQDRLIRDRDKCSACSECRFTCPNDAWFWPEGGKEKLQVERAHAAAAIHAQFKDRVGYINFIQDVTPYCDCAAASGSYLVADVGILASYDPVAIDKASLDLIDRAPLITTETGPPDLLGRLHGVSSLVQLEVAARLGMGSLDYELATV